MQKKTVKSGKLYLFVRCHECNAGIAIYEIPDLNNMNFDVANEFSLDCEKCGHRAVYYPHEIQCQEGVYKH